MSRLNKGKNLPKKRLLKRKTNPKVLKNLAIGLALALVAALIYIKVSPFTHDAKLQRQYQQTIIQSQAEKKKLLEQVQKNGTLNEAQQKQIEELNKKLKDAEAQAALKRSTNKAYAASLGATGSCAEWMVQAGIPITKATTKLIGNESGCDPTVWNKAGSGAYGIPQALPRTKLLDPAQCGGPDGYTNAVTQLKWMQCYVDRVYGGWDNALAKWYSRCGSPQGCWY